MKTSNLKNTFLSPIPSSTHPTFLHCSTGECDLWSLHHTLFLLLFPPHEEDSLRSSPFQYEVTPTGYRDPVFHELFFVNCSRVGLLQGHKSCQLSCSSADSSLHGAAGPARSLFQYRLPRSHSLLWEPTCSGMGYSKDFRCVSVSLQTPTGCRVTAA